MVVEVKNCNGLHSRFLFVTIKKIEENVKLSDKYFLFSFFLQLVLFQEILSIDYGDHDVKKMPYIELRLEEMIQFFSGKTKEELLDPMIPKKLDKDISYEQMYQFISQELTVKYVLKTPSALLTLLLKDVVSLDVFSSLFNQHFLNTNKKSWQYYFFEDLQKLFNLFSSSEDKNQVKQDKLTLLSLIESCSALEISIKIEETIRRYQNK